MRTPLALLSVALAIPAVAAPPRDPATLFPADSLAYVEVGPTAATAAMIATFFEGTALAGGLDFLHDRRDRLPASRPMTGPTASGELALLASPEMLAEFQRLGGIGAALTGIDKAARPVGAAAVLLGDSHAAGLVVRHFLATSPTLRRVGQVEGQTVYQHRGRPGERPREEGKENEKDDEPRDLSAAAGSSEPTYLYVPGLFAVGTSTAAVADVYRRFTGKVATPDLTAHPQFKVLQPMRKAGVSFFADPAGFDRQYAGAGASSSPYVPDREAYNAARFLAGLPTAAVLVGRFHLKSDGPALELHLHGASPVATLLAGTGATAVGKDDLPQGRLVLKDIGDKPKTLVAVLDALAQARGDVGALPGDRDLAALAPLAGVESVGATWPAGAMPSAWPVLSLECATGDAAKAVEAAVPAVLKWAYVLDTVPTPALDGAVRGLAFKAGETNHRFHYRTDGTALLLGSDVEAVGRKREPVAGTASDFAFAASLPTAAFKSLAPVPPALPTKPVPREAVKRNPPPKPAEPPKAPPPTPTDTLLASLATLPPVKLAARSRAGAVEIVVSHPGAKKPFAEFAKALLVWVESRDDSDENRGGRNYGRFRGD